MHLFFSLLFSLVIRRKICKSKSRFDLYHNKRFLTAFFSYYFVYFRTLKTGKDLCIYFRKVLEFIVDALADDG